MTWEVEATDQFVKWYEGLAEGDQEDIEAVVELLEEQGPALKRPVVGEIVAQRHRHLKELITGSTRIIFAFDPRRTAILLLGGDKAQAGWKRWYRTAVPEAEQLYDEHLAELKAEGLI